MSLPVQIVQAGNGAGPCNPTRVIKDFGTVPADNDTFKARVSFKDKDGKGPEEPTDECLVLSPNPEEAPPVAHPVAAVAMILAALTVTTPVAVILAAAVPAVATPATMLRVVSPPAV